MVHGCTLTNQIFWTEDQFVVTTSSGIRDRDKRDAEIVVREVDMSNRQNLANGDAYRLASIGEQKRRLKYVLDTTG